MKIGNKIKTYRNKLGYTQEELADKIGVSRQSVSKWESNKTYPEMSKIVNLAEMFSVSPEYLLIDRIDESIKGEGNYSTEFLYNLLTRVNQTSRRMVLIILYILLGITLVYQIAFSVFFMIETGNLLPSELTPTYMEWSKSNDQALAVPNFFLVPLVILITTRFFFNLSDKKRNKEIDKYLLGRKHL